LNLWPIGGPTDQLKMETLGGIWGFVYTKLSQINPTCELKNSKLNASENAST